MPDFDYWKKQYQSTWEASSTRESAIAKYLAHASGTTIDAVGLGAGSSEFLPGSAAARGHQKGDPDLAVAGTNVRLEVTGPLVPSIDQFQDLWVRPDKIENARRNAKTHETWIVHHLPKNDLVRAVPLDDAFWQALDAGEFRIVTPRIRGVEERYRAIPAAHRCVKACDVLIQRLTRVARPGTQ